MHHARRHINQVAGLDGKSFSADHDRSMAGRDVKNLLLPVMAMRRAVESGLPLVPTDFRQRRLAPVHQDSDFIEIGHVDSLALGVMTTDHSFPFQRNRALAADRLVSCATL